MCKLIPCFSNSDSVDYKKGYVSDWPLTSNENTMTEEKNLNSIMMLYAPVKRMPILFIEETLLMSSIFQ